MQTPQKLLIDTDPGQDIDDLLVMLFALLRPEVEVLGITTVTMPARGRARLVKRLLRYLGRTDVAVAAGMELPLRPFGPEEWAAQQNLDAAMNHRCFAEPEDPRDEPGAEDAVSLIIRTVEAHPGEVMLACIGPLTNVATVLRRKPSIAPLIKGIAIMGGEVELGRCEHNVAWDYVAADIVLSAGIPVAMGTWSVTRQFTLTMAECEVFRSHATEVGQALGRAIDAWHLAQNWKPGPVMYDLFPIVWALDRELYQTKPMGIRVETRGEFTRGMTVVRQDGPKVEVTTGIAADRVRDLYLATVRGYRG